MFNHQLRSAPRPEDFWARELRGEWVVFDKRRNAILLLDRLGKFILDQYATGSDPERTLRVATEAFGKGAPIQEAISLVDAYLRTREQRICHCSFAEDRGETSAVFDLASARLVVGVIEATVFCNLDCPQCVLGGRRDKASPIDLRTFADWLDVYYEYGVRQVVLTGGEPLLHPDIVALAELASSYPWDVKILTNGLLLTRELLSRLRKPNLRLQITSHFLDENRRAERSPVFRLAIDAIGRDNVEMAVVLGRGSLPFLQDEITFACSIGIPKVIVTFLESQEHASLFDLGREPTLRDRLEVGSVILRWNDQNLAPKVILSGNPFRPVDFIMAGIPPEIPSCSEIVGEFTVLTDGTPVPCSRWCMPTRCGLSQLSSERFTYEPGRSRGVFTKSPKCEGCHLKAFCVIGCLERSLAVKQSV